MDIVTELADLSAEIAQTEDSIEVLRRARASLNQAGSLIADAESEEESGEWDELKATYVTLEARLAEAVEAQDRKHAELRSLLNRLRAVRDTLFGGGPGS